MRRAFLCPPDTPEGVITRCVRVPASQQWLAVFNQALLMLTQPGLWEQVHDTDITPEVAAARAYTVYTDWLNGGCSLDCNDVLGCLPTYTTDMLRAGTYNIDRIDPTDDAIIDARFPSTSREGEILPPPADCNLDEMWAGVLEIATRIDGNGRDFWEIITAQADKIERVAEAIALVPLFGDIVGEGLALLAEVAPDMLNLYAAYSSQSAIEAIACDLFSTTCGECRYPTYQELYDYYSGQSALGAANWVNIALEALLDVLLGTSGSSPGIVYMTTNILQLWVLATGARFASTMGVNFIALWAGLGSATPSDGWELLCGGCGDTWEHMFLNGDGHGDWTALPAPISNYCTCTYDAVNDRWDGCLPINNSARYAIVNVTSGATFTITGVSVTMAYKNTRASATLRIESPYGTVLAQRTNMTGTGTTTLTWSGDLGVTQLALRGLAGGVSSGDGGYARLTQITVSGRGYDPFA